MTEIYALDYDEELLSHLPDPEAWVQLRAEGFKPDLIEDEFVRDVYSWQSKHLHEHGAPATASVLSDQFDLELADPLTAIGDLLERMRGRYMKNSGRKVLQDVGRKFQEDPLAIPDILTKEGRSLQALLSKHGEMYGTGDWDRAKLRYEQKVARGKGASFGFPDLDNYFFGQHGITIMCAPPKTYKSWFMLKGVEQNIEEGRNSWIYSLELPCEESDMRLRCLVADVPWWHYLHNRITREEQVRLERASEVLDSMGIYKIVKPPEGERGIDQLVSKARDAGAEIVFVDQLQYVEGRNGRPLGENNDPGEYWGVLQRARDLSDEGPICFAHQFNRSTLYSDEMPDVKQAKGSSAIEETATLVLGMWANKDMRRSHKVELGTCISRNYMYSSWEVEVEMNKGCSFEIVRKIEDD